MNPKAMPLDQYLAETLHILNTAPEAAEVVVERAKPSRLAERGDFDAFFKTYNDNWIAAQSDAWNKSQQR